MDESSDDNENVERAATMDLDELLPYIGEFGTYQKLLLWCICLPACIPCGFCAFNQLFMTSVPHDYWCAVPGLANLTLESQRALAIPYDEATGEYSKCTRYAIEWDKVDDYGDFLEQNKSLISVEMCKDGWYFNETEPLSTIVVGFNLVCEHDIYPTYALVALNLGGPVGVYMFGILNDRMGRKVAYFCCLATLLGGSFITAISKDFWLWGISRVIVGTTVPAVYQIPFIVALELVGPHYRSFVTVMTCTFYTFGLMLLAIVTYFIRDWVLLCWTTSLPFLLYFLYIAIMPESPRWLLAKGKHDEALVILENMARINKKELPSWFRKKLAAQMKFAEDNDTKPKDFTAFDLCRTPNMRLKTFLITLNWFANETVYLGLSYYGPNLGKNPYLSFFLSSLVEIPSYVVCWFAMDKWGRRWPMSILMSLGGIACIATVLLPPDAVDGELILFLVSKSMLSASFLIIYPYAGEIYPTEVRGIGIGFSSYVGGIGLIIIPFITYLGKDNLRLPLIIMGALAVFGGCTGMRLPETLHKRLPVTLEEGEQFGNVWTCCAEDWTPEMDGSPDEDETMSRMLVDDIPITSAETFTKPINRASMKRLARQKSVMDTQKTRSGEMKLTYWF